MLGAVGLAVATVATTFAAAPASASPAPLVTEDGVGIRIDENAILGPALSAIEAELQPYVNDRIYQGALENSVMDNPDWVQGTADLDLSFDFIAAGTPGYPEGGLKVRGDLRNIMMRFYRYGAWWQPECQFRVNPADGWIEATAKIDTTKLPNAPLTINPIQAYWDNDPDITREKGNFLCTGYLLDEWWNGLWGNTTDVAAQLEAELDDVAQDLIDSLWTDYVTPVVDTLGGFGITWGDIRTDDHGLIVTADVDASSGISLPGTTGVYNVSGAQDSGATSSVSALLAQRGEVIVSVHPNVLNQYLDAIKQLSGGDFGTVYLDGPSIENILLTPADRAAYDDNSWFARLEAPGTSPYVTPSGSSGAPLVGFPAAQISIYNEAVDPFSPIATFSGDLENIGLITEVRSGTGEFGPSLVSSSATLTSLTRTYANSDAAKVAPQSGAQLLPTAKLVVDGFSDGFLTMIVTIPPLTIDTLSVSLCTTCGRYPGDQRYTETLLVG